MSYLFSKHLLLRMPVKKPEDYAAANQIFLDDPHFLSALYLASPVFFATLERQHFESGNLTGKEENTLRKYINRFCFRPTPFGLFASVSLVQWSAEPGPQDFRPPVFKAKYQADQTFQAILGKDLLGRELAEQARYESNPSIYRVVNEYRFLRSAPDESFRQREYLLQSIAFSKLLKDLISWCRKDRSQQEIMLYIMKIAKCTLTEAGDYADFLVDAQLLVNRLRPNINGPDYLHRLLHYPQLPFSSRGRELGEIYDKGLAGTWLEPAAVQQLSGRLKALLPEEQASLQSASLNVILERQFTDAGIDLRYQRDLRDGLYALDILSPEDRLPALKRFISSFQQDFEGQTLSLLAAMDPETGIGYQQPVTETSNPLLDTLHIPYRAKADTTVDWTPAQSLLLESWLRYNRDSAAVITLDEKDLQKLGSPENLHVTGMSVLFRISGDHIFIESAGGNNAPALMGRFTLVNDEIGEAAGIMAHHIELQNPRVIFAELLHLADPHVDNVNRRKNIYSYELPITAVSTVHKERQLELADLYVRIEQGKVVLFSKKHDKPVIPRLSSAYNHSLNKLPLFRFLADLPYQYGRFNLSFDLRQYFPGQRFYPRVAYRNTILSLATWIISSEKLEELMQQPTAAVIGAFRRLSDSIHLPPMFSLAEGDQQLVFNRENESDILFFCHCIRQNREVIIKEFLPQQEIRQYNAYLLPAEPLAFPVPGSYNTGHPAKVKRKYMPGSEWLYLKIYAPRAGAAGLLLRLQPLLSRRYAHGKISKWFFIRYDDHAPHIRLRLKVAPEDIGEVLLAFKTKLEDRIQQHVIREYQIDVYNRELERYAAAGMEKTEDFFSSSSELIIHFLKKNRYDLTGAAHYFGMVTVQVMISLFFTDPDDQLAFTLESYQHFLPEFAAEKLKIELDKKYRELSAGIHAAFNSGDPGLLSGSARAARKFIAIVEEINALVPKSGSNKTDYLRSIIHMHLNRLSSEESRKQEMIVYYLLHKYQRSLKGRNKD
jgi:thiopeptide-type bacteriocin biosynthesis protein